MTLSRFYDVQWTTNDLKLDALLRGLSCTHVTLREAMLFASEVKAMFDLDVEIKSVSAFGTLLVKRRHLVVVRQYPPLDTEAWMANGYPWDIAVVLARYKLGDVRRARLFLSNSIMEGVRGGHGA